MRITINKPEPYDMTHKDRLFGNFYWDIEQYLAQLNISLDEVKVNVATIFWTRTANP
jgi:hypothetical protein